jgi:predicted porin
MHKKLIVVAVAGALAAPAMALAQTTIYGYFNAEWSPSVSQPDTYNGGGTPEARWTGEGFNSGASRIGFRGEEKLGGSNSAWYQCETELGLFPRDTGITVCDRNSAVGLKGGWGNFYVGSWDSPLKRVSGIVRISNETGWLGSQDMTLRGATTTAAFNDAGVNMPNFSNRNTNSFNYDTPNFGGFGVSLQTTTTQATIDTVEDSADSQKGRINTISGQWLGGPIAVVAAYSEKTKNRSNFGNSATGEGKDTAYLVGGSYVIGPVKVGLTYTSRKSDDGTDNIERAAYNLAADWKITGSGTIRVGFALADDLESSVAGFDGNATGANQIQIAYLHALSKRTTLTVGYVKVDNDTNGNFNLTDMSTNVKPGDSASAFMLGLSHSF